MYLCNYFLSKSPSNRILGSTDWQILELSFEIRNGDNYFSWSLPTLDITIDLFLYKFLSRGYVIFKFTIISLFIKQTNSLYVACLY